MMTENHSEQWETDHAKDSGHHPHGHAHHHHHHHSTGNLKVAFFLNLAFTIIEIIGGYLTNSVAILTDAVHDLGDSLSLGLAWYFDGYSTKKRSPTHTYGYRRYRLLGGLITGIVLVAGICFVLTHAIARLRAPEEVKAPGMLLLAIIGILFNGAAVLRVQRGTSLTEKMVSWHLIEDTLGWVAVLIGAGIMMIWNVPIIDPLLSIGLSLFVLWNVGKNLKQVMAVFLQSAPEEFCTQNFEECANKIEGVSSLHHVHCWSIDGEQHVFSAHVVLTPDAPAERLVKRELRALLKEYPFSHITLETEAETDTCAEHDRHDV